MGSFILWTAGRGCLCDLSGVENYTDLISNRRGTSPKSACGLSFGLRQVGREGLRISPRFVAQRAIRKDDFGEVEGIPKRTATCPGGTPGILFREIERSRCPGETRAVRATCHPACPALPAYTPDLCPDRRPSDGHNEHTRITRQHPQDIVFQWRQINDMVIEPHLLALSIEQEISHGAGYRWRKVIFPGPFAETS